MRKKTISTEEDYENNSNCRNCPYFINKLRCPFQRKVEANKLILTNQEQGKKAGGDEVI